MEKEESHQCWFLSPVLLQVVLWAKKKKKKKKKGVSHSVVSDSLSNLPGSSVHGLLQARILEWLVNSLLQGILLTQGSNLGFLHCMQAGSLYLSHKGSPSHQHKHSPALYLGLVLQLFAAPKLKAKDKGIFHCFNMKTTVKVSKTTC